MRLILQASHCTLLLTLVLGRVAAPVHAQNIYVDPGNFGPSNGTPDHPYPTLSSAAAAAPAGSRLVLRGYQYTNTFTITYPETGFLPLIINKNLKLTTQDGAAQIGQPLGTQRLWQLTGETDLERGTNTPGQTVTRFGLLGTDLGSSFEHGDRIYFLFGDTIPSFNAHEKRPKDTDSVAWIPADTDPEKPVSLNFIKADDGYYGTPNIHVPPGVPRVISQQTCEVPLSGFSANGQMYVFFSTDRYPVGSDECNMGSSVLTKLNRFDNPEGWFDYLYDVSCRPEICPSFTNKGKFINIAPVVVTNAGFHDLIQEIGKGEGVLLWGSGLYHKSNPYLAFLPLNAIEDPTAWSYAVTDGAGVRWSTNESDATCLFDQPWLPPEAEGGIGELSVASIPYVDAHGNRTNKWIMTYNHLTPFGIHYRVADKPWGPWDGPYVLFDPSLDRGIGHFMQEGGAPYGPYVISRFTKSDATTATIYWTMSTWEPYQVMLMKSTLRLSDWRRVDHLLPSR